MTQQNSGPAHKKLGQWSATAICGNDITSSCLYVAAICILAAGYLAPISLLVVVFVLFLYRKIYAEVGDALPLNGGAYNCLLNTTSKFRASIAACMTIVSYVATAVISAKTAVSYVASVTGFEQEKILILGVTVLILAIFATLTIIGIGESAKVALGIFIFHMFTLVIFVGFGAFTLIRDQSMLIENLSMPLPDGRSIAGAIFFGFGAALLGISGFESSANYIEEQAPGVFVKTLRNMWIAVSVFNPTIAVLALAVLPMTVLNPENTDFLLKLMAEQMGGPWLAIMIAVDAALVLCGAVLTSFVGVNGLVKRMTLDRCLPQFLLKENKRGTTHRIVISFFLLSASILLITQGDVVVLGGVYAIAFLLVMSLFAIGNILLKVRRAKLPRHYRASVPLVVIALAATITGVVANTLKDPRNVQYFLLYFSSTVIIVAIMFWRTHLLRLLLFLVNSIVSRIDKWAEGMTRRTEEKIDQINSVGIIFFTKGDSVANLNLAMLYVRANELTNNLKVVHLYNHEEDIPPNLATDLALLDKVYPDLNIELVKRKGRFTPETIEVLSEEFNIPKNYMFIGAPGERFPHELADLGGVRLII
jgi:amino acid transporter